MAPRHRDSPGISGLKRPRGVRTTRLPRDAATRIEARGRLHSNEIRAIFREIASMKILLIGMDGLFPVVAA